jgi:hypothetical protein
VTSVCALFVAALLTVSALAWTPPAPPDPAVGQAFPFDLAGFRAWLDLARQHRPGELDAAVEAHRKVKVDTLASYEFDLRALIYFIQHPDRQRLPRLGREYSTGQGAVIRGIAQAEGQGGRSDDLLRKIALLQSDSVMLPGGQIILDAPHGSSLPRDIELATDGIGVGRGVSPPNWSIARTALAAIPPSPAALEWARRWYAAANAFLFRYQQLGVLSAQIPSGKSLLGDRGDLLFDEGCFYEAHADPRIQRAMEEGRSRGASYPLGDRRTALSRARDSFEQAIARDRGHLEARLRLARVQWALGNARQSATDLDALIPALKHDRELLYLAQLFLGASHETLGNLQDAAGAYGEAMRLYPFALSGVLSRIRLGLQPSTSDSAALERALRSDRQRLDDPWTNYFQGPGRDAQALAEELWRVARAGDR